MIKHNQRRPIALAFNCEKLNLAFIGKSKRTSFNVKRHKGKRARYICFNRQSRRYTNVIDYRITAT